MSVTIAARFRASSACTKTGCGTNHPGTADGVLSHTVSGQAWQNLRFNGTLVGETGINAALCGHWGVPVVLVTGDRAVCREGRELLGDGLT